MNDTRKKQILLINFKAQSNTNDFFSIVEVVRRNKLAVFMLAKTSGLKTLQIIRASNTLLMREPRNIAIS